MFVHTKWLFLQEFNQLILWIDRGNIAVTWDNDLKVGLATHHTTWQVQLLINAIILADKVHVKNDKSTYNQRRYSKLSEKALNRFEVTTWRF